PVLLGVQADINVSPDAEVTGVDRRNPEHPRDARGFFLRRGSATGPMHRTNESQLALRFRVVAARPLGPAFFGGFLSDPRIEGNRKDDGVERSVVRGPDHVSPLDRTL